MKFHHRLGKQTQIVTGACADFEGTLTPAVIKQIHYPTQCPSGEIIKRKTQWFSTEDCR